MTARCNHCGKFTDYWDICYYCGNPAWSPKTSEVYESE